MAQAGLSKPPVIPLVPSDLGNPRSTLVRVTGAVNQILRGTMGATMGITLAANDTTSTFSDSRIGPYTSISLMPTSANAAAIAPSIWFQPTKGAVTIHHANSPNTDMTFTALLLG